jgi:uncharacterized protein involved in propanediol utilization
LSGCSGSDKQIHGAGCGIGHAGELLQGVIRNDQNTEPFLVTLPAPPFTSRATVRYSEQAGDTVQPPWKTKALRAARIAWRQLAGRSGPIRLIVDSRTPVGRGCGSSTSDCVAAIRAVADLRGCQVPADDIALWTTQAETAADATMFELRPVAFSQRRGRVLRPLGAAYPPMRVIAVDLGGPPVDSVGRPVPAYSRSEIAGFGELLARLEKSIVRQDASALARVATESAAIQQSYYPHPRWQEFAAFAKRPGVLGVACAHSGTVSAALLGPGETAAEEELVRGLDAAKLVVLARYELSAAPKGEFTACLSF